MTLLKERLPDRQCMTCFHPDMHLAAGLDAFCSASRALANYDLIGLSVQVVHAELSASRKTQDVGGDSLARHL